MSKIQIKKCYPHNKFERKYFQPSPPSGTKFNLSILKDLIQIEHLNLSKNEISDITPLKNLVNLKELKLFENQISDITPLQNLVNLEKLDLERNEISDLTPLKNLVNLKVLWLEDDPISQQQIEELKKALPKCRIYLVSIG